jgi:molybdate transport system ATP-binding protein
MSRLEFDCRLRYPTGFQLDARFTTESLVTALVGPSGSGKTSILSMIAGLRRPDSGRIRLVDLNGRDGQAKQGERVLYDSAAAINLQPERRRVGYVFQDHLLFPHLSVRENLRYGMERRAADARSFAIEEVVEVLELGELLTRPPPTLSGGQRQRVALGRALLCGPDLLLMDEPLASVHQELKGQLLEFLRRSVERWHVPTIYVTHDPAEAATVAGGTVRVEAGAVVETRNGGST